MATGRVLGRVMVWQNSPQLQAVASQDLNTPAHIVFSLALCGKERAWMYPLAIGFGAILPDLPMFVFYGIQKLAGVPEMMIWGEHYFDPGWQALFDTFNSIPLITAGLVVALWRRRLAVSLTLVSMLIHCLLDLPVHHDDGHRHFFPLSDWRYASPVSYWDPAHYGQIVGTMEILLVAVAIVWLWRQPLATAGVRRFWGLSTLRWLLVACSLVYTGFFVFVALTWSSLGQG